MIDFATKIAVQYPIWFRGATRALSSIANGEFLLHSAIHSTGSVRSLRKDKTGCLVYRVVEPVPARLAEPEIILETAPHAHAGLLWLEFLASPEAQLIIDGHEPLKSSLYVTGFGRRKSSSRRESLAQGVETLREGSPLDVDSSESHSLF